MGNIKKTVTINIKMNKYSELNVQLRSKYVSGFSAYK